MSKVLIIDDDELLCKMLCRYIGRMGHEAAFAPTLEDGAKELSSKEYDVVFLDVNLPDGNGLSAIPRIQETPCSPEIIIITGEGDADGAESAIMSGAWAYLEKPPSMDNVTLQVTRALQYRQERRKSRPPAVLKREGIIGSSPALEASLDSVAQVANTEVNVLLTGETGVGKELFAQAVHKNSSRAGKSFVVVDCTVLPENLVESMLFGHEKGAFTGAEKTRMGLVKEADGGTLFLDEVGELPLHTQKDFLRVLQESRFRPVGGKEEVESNFRLVSATNRDLEAMVAAGRFRKDLFYRLQAVKIELPPLRSRAGDIKDLAMHYMVEFCEQYAMETKGISPDFFEALTAYDWPGNVRELINTMERVVTAARFEPTLYTRHLPTAIRVRHARSLVKSNKEDQEKQAYGNDTQEMLPPLSSVRETALSQAEKQYLADLMLFTKKSIKDACRISGLSQSRLYDLLKKHSITRS